MKLKVNINRIIHDKIKIKKQRNKMSKIEKQGYFYDVFKGCDINDEVYDFIEGEFINNLSLDTCKELMDYVCILNIESEEDAKGMLESMQENNPPHKK